MYPVAHIKTIENNAVVDQYWHPIGLTSLLYLREALKHERYEECEAYIKIALEFGATRGEIQTILQYHS